MKINDIIKQTKDSVKIINIGGRTVQEGAEIFETHIGEVRCVLSPSNASGQVRGGCSTRVTFFLNGKRIAKAKLDAELS